MTQVEITGKVLDLEFFYNLLKKWDLKEDYIITLASPYIAQDSLDINEAIKNTLFLIRIIINRKVNEFLNSLDSNKYIILRDFIYSPFIFVNYLDSCIDDDLFLDEVVTKDSIDEEKLLEYLIEYEIIKRK